MTQSDKWLKSCLCFISLKNNCIQRKDIWYKLTVGFSWKYYKIEFINKPCCHRLANGKLTLVQQKIIYLYRTNVSASRNWIIRTQNLWVSKMFALRAKSTGRQWYMVTLQWVRNKNVIPTMFLQFQHIINAINV